jgi:hypothetical protein
MGSDKILGQQPLMQRRSSGKRGSSPSEGDSGDDADRELEKPPQAMRGGSAFKYEGLPK